MKVELKHTALELGSGDMEVFGTPAMVALMENAAMRAAQSHCQDGETTVGIALNIIHSKATPLGDEVAATATLIGSEGRKLSYEVVAHDSSGEIGRGTHDRFIVNRAKFIAKL